MKNKKIWIIGASFGIGESLALELAKDNLVCISARSLDKLLVLKNQMSNTEKHLSVSLDVTSSESLENAYNQILSAWGNIDIVIYASGIYEAGGILDIPIDKGLDIINTNLNGALRVLKIVIPNMLANNSGHIAFFASASAYGGLANAGFYGVSKAAILYMCETLKLDLYNTNIKIQVINPGFVKTRLTQKNKFQMPFLMDPKNASQYIIKGLNTTKFDIAFPKSLILPIKFLQLLPYNIYFKILSKVK
jgi:short-subunit dehydrogenase